MPRPPSIGAPAPTPRPAAWLLAVAALLCGCSATADPPAATGWPDAPPPPLSLPQPSSAARTATRLAVIGTDFQVSGLSWLPTATPADVRSGVFDSGAVVSAAGAALSGDVALARTPPPTGGRSGPMLLIDRADGVLTSVETDGAVRWQRSIADDFFANPQDALEVAPGHLFVVRAQASSKNADDGNDADDGDDVLHLRIGGDIAPTRIPLAPHATLADSHAFGGRMAFDGEGLWVPLASYRRDFSGAGPGRVVRIDPASDTVTAVVDVPAPLRGCVAATYAADAEMVAVACVGDFDAKADVGEGQRASSGIALIDPVAATLVAQASAEALDLPGPIGFSLAALDRAEGDALDPTVTLAVTSLGSLAGGTPDTLWTLTWSGDRAAGIDAWLASERAQGGDAWTITALAWDRTGQQLFFARHDDPEGDIRTLQRGPDGAWAALPALVSWPKQPRAFDLALF